MLFKSATNETLNGGGQLIYASWRKCPGYETAEAVVVWWIPEQKPPLEELRRWALTRLFDDRRVRLVDPDLRMAGQHGDVVMAGHGPRPKGCAMYRRRM
jgi:hypothetical protein